MTRFVGTFALCCVLCAVAFAQSADPAFGIPPFSTVTGSKFDTIDLATSNVILTLPLRNKIGKMPFASGILGGGRMYQVPATPSIPLPSWVPDTGNYFEPVFGQGMQLYLYEAYTQQCGSQPYDPVYTGFAAIDASGISHSLQTTPDFYMDEYGCWGSTTATLSTSDGSGFTATINSATLTSSVLYDRFGNSVSLKAALLTDPDNVSMTIPLCAGCADSNDSYIDTLGETTLTVASFANSYGPTKGVYSYSDVSNNTQSYTVTYTDIPLATNFRCSGVNDIPGATAGFPLPTQVIAPDGGVYTVSYEPTPGKAGYVTGRIAKITLPIGGYVSYQYTGGNNGISCGGAVVPTMTRTTNDGAGHNAVWTYVNNQTAWNQAGVTVKVTDPAGNLTVVSFDGSLTGYRTESQSYQGLGGTPLVTTITCYNGTFTNCTTTNAGPRALAITQTDVFTYRDGSSSGSLLETKYDSYGDVTEVKQYESGAVTSLPPAGAPTVSPLSDTTTVYGTWNGSSCSAMSTVNSTIGAYMHAYPCTVTTVNSAGAMVSQKRYTYNAGGHPIQTQSWLSGTGASAIYLSSSATYTAKGTVATSTDVNGALSTYSYNGTDGCSNSVLPTSVTVTGTGLPLAGLTTSTQWNCNGAVATQTSDPNLQPTGYTYTDPLWRVTSTTDPLLNATGYSYPTQTTSETTMSFPSASNKLYTTDGLGRMVESQTRTAPAATTFDNAIVYGYGWNTTGAVATQTLPGGTAVTTTQYDAIGRPLSTSDAGGGAVSYTYVQNDVLQSVGPSPAFQKQLEYDGLGRLTRVCEITSVSGSGSCGQTNPATGFLTTYAYTSNASDNLIVSITQNAQPGAIGGTQTRKYTYDGLNRLLSETNPEWGPGTANYTYDVACGTLAASGGDLTTRVDNAGNTSCYGYDALHRITDVIVYKAGACYPPVKRFRYDNTTNTILPLPSGYSASNTSGRMIEAWTGDCVWPTPASGSDSATDEWFAYSLRGENTGLWESTAHIAGYFHGTASYAANGALASVGGVPGYAAVTYGVDGEGRLNTATQGTTDLVTAAAFTLGSQLKTISLGNGDQDSYLYDTNTGRMTNYTFTVNGATDSGALTWNSNWTLAQLAITDDINSGGTQTCTYSGYDNFGRLGGVSCGSAWSQAFSYDPFGNITKTGSSQWMPGYNSATNHAMPPFTYDNNGNMTNDTLRTYSWYVDNKLGSINSTTCTIFGSTDGTCILYDAFGREVERGVNGAYNEVMYTPVGKTAIMNGETTTVSAYFPLPGGATYYQSGSTGANQYFWHRDWQGSARLSSSIINRTTYFDRGFGPFGESYNNFGNAAGLDFTGDTQDSFAGLLYDTPNRELHPGEGRWMSPDPSGLSAVDPTNPQSWNRYAYVMNNPLSNIDPTGLDNSCSNPKVRALCQAGDSAPYGGSLPSLANNLGSWDPLALAFWGPVEQVSTGEGSYGLYVPFGVLALIPGAQGPPTPPKQQTPQQQQRCADLKAQADAAVQQTSFSNSVVKPFVESLAVGELAIATTGCIVGLAVGAEGCPVGAAASLQNVEMQAGNVLVGAYVMGSSLREKFDNAQAARKQYNAECQ